MFCLLYDHQSRVSTTFVIIFYTCIWIPFLQIKQALLEIVGFLFFFYTRQRSTDQGEYSWSVNLPAARFEDVKCNTRAVEEMCSVCLVEFEREDVVSQLGRCGHVFHLGCIERWLQGNHFSCPLCRTLFLHAPCKSSCR